MRGTSLTYRKEHIAIISQFLSSTQGNYMEIGVYDGVTFCGFAQKFSDRVCYAIDPFIEDGWTSMHSLVKQGEHLTNQYRNFVKNMDGLSNIRFYRMTSIQFNRELTPKIIQDMNVSAIYIDGSHQYADVLNDMHMAVRLIGTKKGLVLFDDIQIVDVQRAIKDGMLAYSHHFKSVTSTHYLNQ